MNINQTHYDKEKTTLKGCKEPKQTVVILHTLLLLKQQKRWLCIVSWEQVYQINAV